MTAEGALEESPLILTALAASGPDEALDSLASLAASGDRGAFALIYEQTSDELFRFVRALSRDDTVAEDIVSSTYLRAWRSARSYRTGTNTYRRWLLRIARNQLNDYWRANKDTISLGAVELPTEDDPSRDLIAGETGREVTRLMQALNPHQREVVVLRYIHDLSFQEIAYLLGKREGAVRSQLLRALRHMRKVMDDAAS